MVTVTSLIKGVFVKLPKILKATIIVILIIITISILLKGFLTIDKNSSTRVQTSEITR